MRLEPWRLFPDEAFADLFADIGRASVPPRIVSVVMMLQRLEGLSDREATDPSRSTCDGSLGHRRRSRFVPVENNR